MQSHAKGGACMAGAAGCLAIQDALCKWLMPDYSVGQIIAVRSVAVLILIGGASLLWRTISCQLVFKSYRLHAIRAGLHGLSAVLFLSGLAYMPLTNAIALSFTSPLFVVALAGPFLGERVVAKGWIAVGIGFIGMLLVLNPSVEQFGQASVLPAIAAVISAVADLMTRRMSSRETSLSFVLSTTLGALAFGVCTAMFGWRWLDAPSMGLVGLAGLFVLLAHYLIAEAFRSAPAFYVSPFRYSALIWGLLITSLIWRQTPDPLVLVGSVVLIVSGVYLASGRWA